MVNYIEIGGIQGDSMEVKLISKRGHFDPGKIPLDLYSSRSFN